MIDPIGIGLTKEYTLKSDKKNPTIWIIGAIDSMMAQKVASKIGRVEMVKGQPEFVPDEDIANHDFKLVKYGLKGFRNFKIKGEEVKFKTIKENFFDREVEVVHDDILKQIPLFAIHEIAMEIWGSNIVKEEEEKN